MVFGIRQLQALYRIWPLAFSTAQRKVWVAADDVMKSRTRVQLQE